MPCLALCALLAPFGVTRYYTDRAGVYRRHLPPEQHTVGKLGRQKIEHKHLTLQTRLKDYGTKPPPHDLKSQCHCERSEAIFARKQSLLRHLPLLAMTAPPSRFFSVAKVLSHGPKYKKI